MIKLCNWKISIEYKYKGILKFQIKFQKQTFN